MYKGNPLCLNDDNNDLNNLSGLSGMDYISNIDKSTFLVMELEENLNYFSTNLINDTKGDDLFNKQNIPKSHHTL